MYRAKLLAKSVNAEFRYLIRISGLEMVVTIWDKKLDMKVSMMMMKPEDYVKLTLISDTKNASLMRCISSDPSFSRGRSRVTEYFVLTSVQFRS